jgi:hypothetical protein
MCMDVICNGRNGSGKPCNRQMTYDGFNGGLHWYSCIGCGNTVATEGNACCSECGQVGEVSQIQTKHFCPGALGHA